MPTTSRRGPASIALMGLSVVTLLISSCNWDTDSPDARRLRPAGPARTITYPHTSRTEYGPCYVWGQNNPLPTTPPTPYSIGMNGGNTADTTCGIPLYFDARRQDLVYSDTIIPQYILEGDTYDSQVIATRWFTWNPHTVLWGGQGGGLALLAANFQKPIRSVTVRFKCPVVSGFRLEVWASDGGVLASQNVPVVPADPSGTWGGCGYPVAYSDVTLSAPSITKVVAYGPTTPMDANPYSHVGIELWIVPDSTPHLQITVAGGTDRFVGDTLRYLASMSDGSTATITRWKWIGDTTRPAGMIEKDSVPACNSGKKPQNPCPHTPLTSGMIWLYGTVNRKADSISRHINVGIPRIAVTCTPLSGGNNGTPVARDDIVQCTASSLFRSLSITNWKFVATDTATGTHTEASTRWDWTGTAVASGVVTVTGTVNGASAISDTGRVVIADRTGSKWSSRQDTLSVKDDSGHFECHTERHYVDSLVAGWDGPPKCGAVYMFIPQTNDSTVKTKQVTNGGPNGGFWYVDSVALKLEFHAQVLKDLRPDGFLYAVDSATLASCAATGDSLAPAQQTVTRLNTLCKKNSSFSAYYSGIWRHEQCHAVVAIAAFESLPDPKTAAERVVRPTAFGVVTAAIYDIPNSIDKTNTAINHASSALDTLPKGSHSMWSFKPDSSKWWLRPLLARDGIVSGC